MPPRDPERGREAREARLRARERVTAAAATARSRARSADRPPFEDVRTALDTGLKVLTIAARDGALDAEGVQAVLGSLLTARALMDRADVMTAPPGQVPGRDRYATMGGGTGGGCTHAGAVEVASMGGATWVCECGQSGELPR